jgi:hypothetical protein
VCGFKMAEGTDIMIMMMMMMMIAQNIKNSGSQVLNEKCVCI